MKIITTLITLSIVLMMISAANSEKIETNVDSVYEFEAKTIDGENKSLSEYKGKVILIVNVASKCGFTKHYAGLQELYEKYKDDGFVVLGFPCNQFGGQEPGTEAEIKEFCSTNYGVDFPMFSKIDVNGSNAHPLYKYLKSEKGGLITDEIKWNLTKFLIGKDGKPIKRYATTTSPKSIGSDIETALNI